MFAQATGVASDGHDNPRSCRSAQSLTEATEWLRRSVKRVAAMAQPRLKILGVLQDALSCVANASCACIANVVGSPIDLLLAIPPCRRTNQSCALLRDNDSSGERGRHFVCCWRGGAQDCRSVRASEVRRRPHVWRLCHCYTSLPGALTYLRFVACLKSAACPATGHISAPMGNSSLSTQERVSQADSEYISCDFELTKYLNLQR